jgi:hypothetical protein
LRFADRAIYGVLLSDSAQIDLHPFGEDESRPIPLHLFPADRGEQSGNCLRRWQSVRTVEMPDAPENSGRDVETPLAQTVTLSGEVQELGRLLIDRNGAAVRSVDMVYDAVVPIPAVLALDPPRFVCACLSSLSC